MAKSKSGQSEPPADPSAKKVNLRELAEYLGLSVATVSLVMNRSPAAKSIPQQTQQRVRVAARELNYRPNAMARMLRQQRTFTIGVMVPEISEGYAALVLSGIEDHLLQEGYFYFVVSHRHKADLIEEFPGLLQQRGVEGLILVDTECNAAISVPAVAISSHRQVEGVTNITLNHTRAAELALEYLAKQGHRKVAFIKGQAFSSDTEVRWKAVRAAAQVLGLSIEEKLVVQLDSELPTSQPGYEAGRRLLESKKPFTALFSFNDISAIGAIRALREAGRSVPEDVSVIGFDDIQSAAFQNPSLTTIRQPLREMGVSAAETLLKRISARPKEEYPRNIIVEPELVVRGSSGKVPS
ncbi:MAG TPA: LacI family DNA-binding transcriptional regulator [Candidatus Dormibacteraeota bacterium]|jgi:DNA-binding LacI/PurR family transcriptional regulator|nr:LacI family DNA-binding transcriptional regulator [Candidatus Dormibacteraeota bacterium]